MKTKKLFPGSMVLILSLLVTSCSIISKPDPTPENPTKTDLVSRGEVTTSYSKFLIKKEDMNKLEKAYMDGNYAIVKNSRGNFSDSKYVEYDLEVLQSYLQYVAEKARAEGVKQPKIRIAFGQYPKNDVISKEQNSKYKGYQTVFIVPVDERNGEKDPVDSTNATNNMMRGTDGLDYGTLKPPY